MQTKIEFDDKSKICFINLAEDMCDAETDEALSSFKKNEKIKNFDKFIILIPKKFSACEEFRIQAHRLILSMKKSRKSKFKLAVVTTLLGVIGYERFAKTVMQMVDQEQIFDTKEKAIAWISK